MQDKKNSRGFNHSFDVQDAIEYGVDIALLIHHFQFWIIHNSRLGRNYIEEKTWMYQTQKELSACLPYYNEKQIQRIISAMIDKGIIVKGNHNKSAYDRTQWYAFKNEEKFSIPRNRIMEKKEPENPKPETFAPIPDTEKDAEKEQQQSAGAFFQKIELLKDVAISQAQKEQICKKYQEDDIRNAIAWATHPQTKINQSLEQAIKWACTNKPEIPKNKEDETQKNKKFAKKYDGKANGYARVDALSNEVEIIYTTCQKGPTCIEYTAKAFKEVFENELRKLDLL